MYLENLKDHIDKIIKLETKDGKIHEGILYTIDPVSESVVIVMKKEDSFDLKVIFEHAIDNVIDIGAFSPIKMWEISSINAANSYDDLQRLKFWLTKNLIPVEECGECLKIAGQVTICPPYGKQDCISSNEVVLNKIQNLIDRMPPA